MAKVSQLYSGNYLAAADLPPNKRFSAFIHTVETEMVGQGADQSEKLVVALVSAQGKAWPKNLVLNKGNAQLLAERYGDDTDHWAGKAVVIWSDPSVMYSGRRVGGVRLDTPQPTAGNGGTPPALTMQTGPGSAAPVPVAGPSRNAPGGNIDDDDIPF